MAPQTRAAKRVAAAAGGGGAASDAEEEKVRLSLYGRTLRRFPLLVNAFQAALLSASSQLLAQYLGGTAPAAFDYAPAAQFALISAAVVTPVSTFFFACVGKLQLKTPASLALDFFVGGPVLNCAFIAALHLVQGRGTDAVVESLTSKAFWTEMVLGSNKVWLPAKVVMYTVIPVVYWNLWCSVVSFGWGIILATLVADT